MREKLLERFKFKRIWFKRKGRKIQLWGEANPEFMIWEKKEDFGDQSKGRRVSADNRYNPSSDNLNWRKKQDGSHEVFSDTQTRKAKMLDPEPIDYNELTRVHGQKVSNTVKKRGDLSKNLGNPPSGGVYEAHHVIPMELATQNDIIKRAIDDGFDFNGKMNGEWLSKYSSTKGLDGVHASHPQYTKQIREYLEFISKKPGFAPSKSKDILEGLASQIKTKISENPTSKLNDLDLGFTTLIQ